MNLWYCVRNYYIYRPAADEHFGGCAIRCTPFHASAFESTTQHVESAAVKRAAQMHAMIQIVRPLTNLKYATPLRWLAQRSSRAETFLHEPKPSI